MNEEPKDFHKDMCPCGHWFQDHSGHGLYSTSLFCDNCNKKCWLKADQIILSAKYIKEHTTNEEIIELCEDMIK